MDVDIYKVIHETSNEEPEKILDIFGAVGATCTKFANSQGLVFESPFSFKGRDSITYQVEGIFPEFGHKGVIVTSNKDDENAITESENLDDYNVIYMHVNHVGIHSEKKLEEMLK